MLPTPPSKAAVKKHMKLSTEEPRRTRIAHKTGLRQEMILRSQWVVPAGLMDSQKPDLPQLNQWRTSFLSIERKMPRQKRTVVGSHGLQFNIFRKIDGVGIVGAPVGYSCYRLPIAAKDDLAARIFRKRFISRFASSCRPIAA